jgi:hypothetical protein
MLHNLGSNAAQKLPQCCVKIADVLRMFGRRAAENMHHCCKFVNADSFDLKRCEEGVLNACGTA